MRRPVSGAPRPDFGFGAWGNLAARRILVPLVLVRIQAPQRDDRVQHGLAR
jgi:hypothetical protein